MEFARNVELVYAVVFPSVARLMKQKFLSVLKRFTGDMFFAELDCGTDELLFFMKTFCTGDSIRFFSLLLIGLNIIRVERPPLSLSL